MTRDRQTHAITASAGTHRYEGGGAHRAAIAPIGNLPRAPPANEIARGHHPSRKGKITPECAVCIGVIAKMSGCNVTACALGVSQCVNDAYQVSNTVWGKQVAERRYQ